MITGAINAVQYVNKPVRLYLVSPTALGFVNGLKGKRPDGALIQQLCAVVKERNCQLTKVQFSGGSDVVKKFMYSCDPDKSQIDELEGQQENDVEKADIEAIMKIIP